MQSIQTQYLSYNLNQALIFGSTNDVKKALLNQDLNEFISYDMNVIEWVFTLANDEKCYEILNFALRGRINPNLKNNKGFTVLDLAIKKNKSNKIINLIKYYGGN